MAVPVWLLKIGISLAVDAVNSYVENSSSDVDDKVLDLAKTSSQYLAQKTNNSITKELANELNKSKMRKAQESTNRVDEILNSDTSSDYPESWDKG